MNIDHLCEFVVIADLGNFSLAAEELYLSQSSLSKHIIALEKELGVKLFDRTSRKIVLTDAGNKVLPFARQIAEIRERITRVAGEEASLQRNLVNIASIPVMAQYNITGVIARFYKERPEVNLQVSEYEYHEISGLLESGKCELAFIRKLEGDAANYEYLPFYKDRVVAVIPCFHYLAARKIIQLQDLKDEDFLFLGKETGLYNLFTNLCQTAGFTPRVKYTGHRPENIIDLVSQGMGVALLMRRHGAYFRNKGVFFVNIIPTVESSICLARLKNKRLSSGAALFWNYIKNVIVKKME